MDWSGQIPWLMMVSISAQRCSSRGSSACSISRLNLGWIGYAPNGRRSKRTIRLKSAAPDHQSSASWTISKRDLRLLPVETEKVWNFLRDQSALNGFVLIGGSALALTIRHRKSEDLDFVYPEVRLPRQRLAAFTESARASGFGFERNDNEAAVEDFTLGGMELHDYQQDFLVNGLVKISFFATDDALRKVLHSAGGDDKVRVASLSELFRAKCLVSAVRSKTRDWLDLYLLMRDHGFTIFDYRSTFQHAGIPHQCDIGLTRLCSGIPQRDDEGYAHLLQNPPTLEEMRAFFVQERGKLEVETAADALRRKQITTGKSDRSNRQSEN